MVDKIIEFIYKMIKWCWGVFLLLLSIEVTLLLLTIFMAIVK